jgi:transcriptional regulator with XRE-family HTH domain
LNADEYVIALLSSFGKSLRHDRRAIELGQLKLARDAGLSGKVVGSLELGRSRDANLSSLTRLASALNGDVTEMLTRYRPEPAGSR